MKLHFSLVSGGNPVMSSLIEFFTKLRLFFQTNDSRFAKIFMNQCKS